MKLICCHRKIINKVMNVEVEADSYLLSLWIPQHVNKDKDKGRRDEVRRSELEVVKAGDKRQINIR